MPPEQYALLQSYITAQAAGYVGSFSKFFLSGGLSLRAWLDFLALLFPQVQQSRLQSAELGRLFYDQQRQIWHPAVERHDVNLVEYEFKDFVADMEPARKAMSVEDSSPKAVDQVQITVARAVENGGRRQIIRAVKTDERLDVEDYPDEPYVETAKERSIREKVEKLLAEPWQEPERVERPTSKYTGKPKAIRGWARVATGRETCEFCLMLVSRGPVYESARTAGLNLDNEEAAIASDKEVNDAMTQWHVGCDCIVVPVFNNTKWEGKAASDKALELWVTAGKRATQELLDNPDKKYYSFKERRWKKTTDNRETINQLRKMLESGEISSSDWAALTAA